MRKKTTKAAVILNGGQSKRMKQDKGLLNLAGISLLKHTQNTLIESKIESIFVSGKNGIQDYYQNKGPISGIFSSLCYLKNYDFILFVPIDMPLLNSEIINKLIKNTDHSATFFHNHLLPILIHNTSKNRSLIQHQITSNELSIRKMSSTLEATVLENRFPELNFTNVNNPKQWILAQRIYDQLMKSQENKVS